MSQPSIQLIRGFKDILPGETALWQYIERPPGHCLRTSALRKSVFPLWKKPELFARSIGEDTDIVEKEMYTFPDRKGEMLTLRPEATASVCGLIFSTRCMPGPGPEIVHHRPHVPPGTAPERPVPSVLPDQCGGVRRGGSLVDAQLIFMLRTLLNAWPSPTSRPISIPWAARMPAPF